MNYLYELITDSNTKNEQDNIIREGISDFNAPFTGGKPERYSVYVKDDLGTIKAGAIVIAYRYSIYIDILWVSEECRRLGIGSCILQCAEAEAMKRGIPYSTLDTFSFQAEGFYLKQGYKHLGTIENYLEGQDRIYLRKQLLTNPGS